MPKARATATLIALAASLAAASAPGARADGAWTLETVESSVLAMRVSLALDPAGSPRVAYNSGAQPRFAWREDGTWHLEPLSTPPTLAGNAAGPSDETQLIFYVLPALAVDEDAGLPRMAYVKYPDYDVWYAERSAGGWAYDRLSTTGERPSLALDAAGRPHVVWSDYLSGLSYAVRDGATWTTEPVGAGVDGILALDGQDHPSVALVLGGPNSDLRYATRGPGGWTSEAVDTTGDVGWQPSLAIDASGAPHVTYYDRTTQSLRYATRAGGVWTVETVASGVGDHCDNSLALIGGVEPCVAYQDANTKDLRFARRQQGAWTSETVESSGDVGSGCSLAVDGLGRPHIGYIDQTNLRVRWATANPVVSVTPGPLPARFELMRVSPNPLRTGLRLEIAFSVDQPCAIRTELIDVSGRRVAVRPAQAFEPGDRTLRWDPRLDRPGVYYLRLTSNRGAVLGGGPIEILR